MSHPPMRYGQSLDALLVQLFGTAEGQERRAPDEELHASDHENIEETEVEL